VLNEQPTISTSLPVRSGFDVRDREMPCGRTRQRRHHSTPKINVPVDENHPPVPFTAASDAPGT
jgi:hypothetical protein